VVSDWSFVRHAAKQQQPVDSAVCSSITTACSVRACCWLRCACRHWKEKDCTEWTKERLSYLVNGLALVSGSCTVKTTGLRSVEGDAYLNVRKAKLIAAYELNVKIDFEGTTADGQKGSGFIELPYVADENHDEDPEIRVVLPVDNKASQDLKAAILTHGKQVQRRAWQQPHLGSGYIPATPASVPAVAMSRVLHAAMMAQMAT
jgi:hypothetical protein